MPARRYARGGELGRGGMGVVEAAVDTWLDRDVAMKRPRPDRPAGTADRLVREARITARLVHPAIPPIYDVGEDEQGPWYTMPVLVGTTLHDAVAARVSLRALVDAVATAARAVGYAHAAGVIHRDLKPANILLGAYGEVWVVDWGVALDPARPDGGVVGTPGFQAPEQARGELVTPAADVYALGRTLEAALAGRDEPALQAIVARATTAAPAARYPDGAALAADLDRWRDGRLVEAHRYPAGDLIRHLAWRWRTPLSALTAAALVAAVIGAGALRSQAAERARADASMSAALAGQAAAYGRTDARAEAEILAAHSLRLAENPLARGVMMAWDATTSPTLVEEAPRRCARPFVEPDGHVLCVDGPRLRVFDPDGTEQPPMTLHDPGAGERVGEPAELRRYGDGTLLVRRSTNRLEVWRDGRLVRSHPQHPGSLGLGEGAVPAIHDQRRVGLIGDDGAVTWGPDTCERIELAWVGAEGTVIGCRERRVWRGDAIDAPGSPSALAWVDGPVVGTFEGSLLHLQGGAWGVVDAGVGAIRQLVPLSAGRVAVVGERGQVRLWDLTRRSWVGQVPRGGVAVARVGDALVVHGDTIRRYALPAAPRPVVFDRRDQGGISTFDVSPSAAHIVAGSASGEVVVWDAATGTATPEVPPGGAAAKAVRFLDEEGFVYAGHEGGVLRRHIGQTSAPFSSAVARAARQLGGEMVLLTWSPRVVAVGGAERELLLPARPLAATWSGGLWVTDERGGVFEASGDALAPRFTLDAPSGGLAACRGLLLVTDGPAIEARTPTGALRWRWTGAAAVSALDANDAWVAAGDVEGRVLLLHPDGRLVAGVAGHDRRVSEVVLRQDRLYSGSWDGTVRVWGLAAATASPASLDEATARRWGLSLDDVLADPLHR